MLPTPQAQNSLGGPRYIILKFTPAPSVRYTPFTILATSYSKTQSATSKPSAFKTYTQQIRALPSIHRPLPPSIKLNNPRSRAILLSRLYETGKVQVGIEVAWYFRLAGRGCCCVNVSKEGGSFQELRAFVWCYFCVQHNQQSVAEV